MLRTTVCGWECASRSSFIRPFLFLSGFLLLSGCVSYQAAPISREHIQQSFEARSLAAPELKTFLEETFKKNYRIWPLQEWTFDELTAVALYYSPALRVAQSQASVVEAGFITAAARPNPSLSLSQGLNTSAPASAIPWILGGSISLPIETAGKRGLRIAVASHKITSAQLTSITVGWQIRNELLLSLLRLHASRQKAELLRQQRAELLHALDAWESRFNHGAASSLELTGARAAAERAQSDTVEADRQVVAAQMSAATIMGIPTLALTTGAVLPPVPSMIPRASVLRSCALLNRSDLSGILAEYDAAEASLALEIAKQYPDVKLGTGYQNDQGDKILSLSFSVDIPLWMRNQGLIAEADARRTEVRERVRALEERILTSIDSLDADSHSLAQELERVSDFRQHEESRARIVEKSFTLGEMDTLERQAARSGVIAARLAEIDSEQRWRESVVRIEEAVQSPGLRCR